MNAKIDGYQVELVDDGTLDTVIAIDGCRHTFSQEYAAEFREPSGELGISGLGVLAKEAVMDHSEGCEINFKCRSCRKEIVNDEGELCGSCASDAAEAQMEDR